MKGTVRTETTNQNKYLQKCCFQVTSTTTTMISTFHCAPYKEKLHIATSEIHVT